MEQQGDRDGEESPPPFWIQSTVDLHHHDGISSVFFSSATVLLLLTAAAVFFMVLVVPSSLSFKPNTIKSSWDSLNLLLVLVALVFGLLGINGNDDTCNDIQAFHSIQNEPQKSNPSTPNKWGRVTAKDGQNSSPHDLNQQWRPEFSDYQGKLDCKNQILRRNSSSFPDLREASCSSHFYYNRWRTFDDLGVEAGERSVTEQAHRRHRSSEEIRLPMEEQETRNVIFDEPRNKSQLFPLPRMMAEGTSLETDSKKNIKDARSREVASGKVTERSGRKSSQKMGDGEKSGGKRERSGKKQDDHNENSRPVSPMMQPEMTTIKSGKKRRVTVTKDIFFNSLYYKKNKKQRQRSIDSLNFLQEAQAQPLSPLNLEASSPPPPPPPPRPSVCQSVFSNEQKQRTITATIHSASTPPPPAPPPPPLPVSEKRQPETISQTTKSTMDNPPELQHRMIAEIANCSADSPSNQNQTPAEPPPPSFLKTPVWKFVMEGDYVRINSDASLRSESPEPGERDADMTPKAFQLPSPEFCPSPDVNTEAENFITKFRANLKLEKIHSLKKREMGIFSPGPYYGPP